MTVSYPHSESSAFEQALLRSERLRILIVLGTIAAAFLLRTIRTVVVAGSENVSSWLATFELLGLFAIYESMMLRVVNRAFRKGQDLGNSVWVGNIIVESFLPAGLILISSSSIDLAYRSLANPAVLVFFFFIILFLVRLNPALSRLSGLAPAAKYLAAPTSFR